MVGSAAPVALTFHRFCISIIDFQLTPGQSVVAKVCIDGMQPSQLTQEEQQLFEQMFGLPASTKLTKKQRKRILLRFGRGSGKSLFSSAVAVYKALTADVSKCKFGDIPTVVLVAPDKELAIGVCLSNVLAIIEGTAKIAPMLQSKGADFVSLRRPDGKTVQIKAFAPTKGGRNIRGRSIIACILDEAEFFNSDPSGRFAVNDRDVYKAMIARLLADGVVIFISTPWPSENLMSELFEANYGKPNDAIAAIAPTLLMRPDNPSLISLREEEMTRDPDNAVREFDCDTSKVIGGTFFDKKNLEESRYENPETLYIPGLPIAIGADFAFQRDSSAIVAVQYDGKTYNVVGMMEKKPREGVPLKPSEVVKEFATFAKSFGARSIIADGHYRQSVWEHLSSEGLGLIDAPQGVLGKEEVYVRTKSALQDGRCIIPDNPQFIGQAASITSRPTSGGRLQIRSPRRAGFGHSDTVSAWTLAVHHLSYSSPSVKPKKLKPGDEGWHAYFMETVKQEDLKREEDYVKELESPKKKAWARYS